MRVISQSGMVDVPYENVAFTVDKSDEYVIHGHTAYEYKACLLAKYSTEEKALKAIEQLRDAYMKNEYYLSIISGAINIATPQEEEIKDCRKLLETAMSSSVFRFPTDDELE